MAQISIKLLPYAASIIVVVWGLAHLSQIKKVTGLFEMLSPDRKQIFMMAWITHAFVMIFIGELVFFITLNHGRDLAFRLVVFWLSAVFLLALGLISLIAVAKARIWILKLDPLIKTLAAGLILLSLLV